EVDPPSYHDSERLAQTVEEFVEVDGEPWCHGGSNQYLGKLRVGSIALVLLPAAPTIVVRKEIATSAAEGQHRVPREALNRLGADARVTHLPEGFRERIPRIGPDHLKGVFRPEVVPVLGSWQGIHVLADLFRTLALSHSVDVRTDAIKHKLLDSAK